VFYGSNLYRKDNPRWAIGNALETPLAPGTAAQLLPPSGNRWDQPAAGVAGAVAGWARSACGICVAWFIGLPRRAGARLHASSDAEARWWHWNVAEYHGGLSRQYRDARFAPPRHDPAPCPGELGADPAAPGGQSPEDR